MSALDEATQQLEDYLASRWKWWDGILDTMTAVVFSTDSSGVIHTVHHGLPGLGAPNLIGRGVADVAAAPHRDTIQVCMREAASKGESRRCEVAFEDTNRWYESTIFPAREGDRLLGFTVCAHDITDEHRHGEELRKHQQMLAQAQELARLGSVTARPPFHAEDMRWSDEMFRILGRDTSLGVPGLNDTIDEYAHPRDRERLTAEIEHSIHTSEPLHTEVRIRRPDGTIRTTRLMAELRSVENEPPTWIATLQDITEQRRLEERCRLAEKLEAIGVLASGIAHDYNNLLMGLSGCLDLARRELSSDHIAAGFIDEAQRAIQRGATLTRQLLAFSRREEVDDPVRAEVDGVIQGSRRLIQSLLGEQIDLVVKLNAEGCKVATCAAVVEHILLNLIVNAHDAMPSGGTLTIETGQSARESRDFVVIRVQDTGIGMDPEIRRQIFEPFFTTKTGRSGTGLGLSTVHGLVSRVGGNIEVTSEPGAGTTFTIYLPRAAASDDASRTPPQEDLDVANGTALIIEDNRLVMLTLRSYLERHGYSVIEASNGDEALQRLQEHPRVDFIITDVILPGALGHEVVRRLECPAIPTIYVSAHPRKLLEEEGRLPQGAAFLQKPFTDTELMGQLGAARTTRRDQPRRPP